MSWRNADAHSAGAPRASWSLAARLTAWYALSSFGMIALISTFIYWSLARYLEGEDDSSLSANIRSVKQVLDREAPAVDLERTALVRWAPHGYERVYLRVIDAATGAAVSTTPAMDERLPASLFPAATGNEIRHVGINLQSPNGEPFRAMSAQFRDARGHAWIVHHAMSELAEFALLAKYRNRLWIVLAISFFTCLAVGFAIAWRGIRPVRDIASAARRIRSTTLHERIDPTGLPAEIAALAVTFNDMLNRLQEAFARLSGFSADIAHELRTPINALRGEIEVALAKPRQTEEYQRVLESCLEESLRVSRLIDSLLFLARAENPRTQIRKQKLDLLRELTTIREFYDAAAAEAGVCIDLRHDGPPGPAPTADLDRALFQRAVGNLVENALRHTPAGGRIVLSVAPVQHNGAGVRIEVADTGSGIPPEHLARIFDRFHRADPARTRTDGCMGLGLAITRTIAILHDAQIQLASRPGEGTRVTMTFPASASRRDAS